MSRYWPYEFAPARKVGHGEWKLGMSAGGSVVLWPTVSPFPEGPHLMEFYRGDREELEQFFITFCCLGYETDPLHKYQGDEVRIFNWRSGTLSQIHVASVVADLLVKSQQATEAVEKRRLYDEAWMVGNAFRDQIEAAERNEGVSWSERAQA